MSVFVLTRVLLGPSPAATARAAAQATAVRVSSSSSSSSLADEPLDALLEQFYAAVPSASACASPERLSELQRLATTAMESCLRQRRPRDAVNLYQAISCSGLLACGAARARRLDELAMQALRVMPHRTQDSLAIRQLLAAEGELDLGSGDNRQRTFAASTLTCRFPTTRTGWTGATAELLPATSPSASMGDTEAFRILLSQHVQLLRMVGQLRLPLGRNYLLSETRHVLDSPTLRAEAEAEPLALLSASILHHPFVHSQPSAKWARRLLTFDELNVHAAAATRDLSEAQCEAVVAIEDGISSLRPLCQPPLRFLTTAAADWDEVLHRRLAESLLLPEEAHDVFPQGYSEQRRRRRSTRRLLLDLEAKAVDQASLSKWCDPSHNLFPACDTSSRRDADDARWAALGRVERIVRRRSRRAVVVPDAAYTLQHFHQLQQLGRHREIVLTHGVLLELVRVAVQRSGPGRFHARRILRVLMQHTTTDRTAEEPSPLPPLKSAHAIGVHRASRDGVTVLGLQDEIAILDSSPARHEWGDVEDDGEGSAEADCTDYCAEGRPVCSTQRSTVLVAHQLARMLDSHARGTSFTHTQQQQEQQQKQQQQWQQEGPLGARPLLHELPLADVGVDSLVEGIVKATHEEGGQPPRHETPLFKSRSRGFWGCIPVVVATTNESTRVAAYMLGLQTYPPTGSA